MKILVRERLSDHIYETPEGYLVCVDSVLARTGPQTYSRNELFHDGDDSEIEVDRSEEEVFSNETLASFENKPLTLTHPDEDVTPENYHEYAVGFVRDIKRGTDNGKPVMLGTIVITDAEAIEGVKSGKYKDLSCGYDCDIDDNSEHPCQKNIRGNHIALCEQGRAGNARIVDSVKDDWATIEYSGHKEKEILEKLCQKYGCKITTQGINRCRIEGPFDSVKKVSSIMSGYQFTGELEDAVEDVEPRAGEKKEDFIERFMSETKSEYPDIKQRYAVANSYWNKKDSVKDFNSDPVVTEFLGNEHLVSKLKILALLHPKKYLRPILCQEPGFNPKMSNAQIAAAAKELGIKLKDIDPYAKATGALEEDANELEEKVKDVEKMLKVATDKNGISYTIFEKEDGTIFVRNSFGKEKEFESLEAAEKELESRGMNFMDFIKDETKTFNIRFDEYLGTKAFRNTAAALGYHYKILREYPRELTVEMDKTQAEMVLRKLKLPYKFDTEDAIMKQYEIRWWDLINKQKGYPKDTWLYDTVIKAESLNEALQKLADKYTFGVGTHNAMIVNIRGDGKTYNLTGRLDDLLRKDLKGYDSVKDNKLDKVVKIVKAINKK